MGNVRIDKRQSPKAPGEFIVDLSVVLYELNRLGIVNVKIYSRMSMKINIK